VETEIGGSDYTSAKIGVRASLSMSSQVLTFELSDLSILQGSEIDAASMLTRQSV